MPRRQAGNISFVSKMEYQPQLPSFHQQKEEISSLNAKINISMNINDLTSIDPTSNTCY
jgi:hypothetical protein